MFSAYPKQEENQKNQLIHPLFQLTLPRSITINPNLKSNMNVFVFVFYKLIHDW